MSSHEKESGRCAWCALPRATKGITVGVVGSLLVHAALLGAVAASAEGAIKKDERGIVAPTRTIYVGAFVIKARKPSVKASNAKEI